MGHRTSICRKANVVECCHCGREVLPIPMLPFPNSPWVLAVATFPSDLSSRRNFMTTFLTNFVAFSLPIQFNVGLFGSPSAKRLNNKTNPIMHMCSSKNLIAYDLGNFLIFPITCMSQYIFLPRMNRDIFDSTKSINGQLFSDRDWICIIIDIYPIHP